MFNGLPLPKRYYHNGFWLSRYGAVNMFIQHLFYLMKFEYSFIAVTASDGDCYMSNFRPRQCGLFIVILSSTLSLKTVVFFYLIFVLRLLSPPSEIQSHCVVHGRTSLCSLFQTALCSLTEEPRFCTQK